MMPYWYLIPRLYLLYLFGIYSVISAPNSTILASSGTILALNNVVLAFKCTIFAFNGVILVINGVIFAFTFASLVLYCAISAPYDAILIVPVADITLILNNAIITLNNRWHLTSLSPNYFVSIFYGLIFRLIDVILALDCAILELNDAILTFCCC